jgi:hypothetical protein
MTLAPMFYHQNELGLRFEWGQVIIFYEPELTFTCSNAWIENLWSFGFGWKMIVVLKEKNLISILFGLFFLDIRSFSALSIW